MFFRLCFYFAPKPEVGHEKIFLLKGKKREDQEIVIRESLNKGEGFFLEQTIIRHMETVRGITEQTIKRIPEEIADTIPKGFNNNIRWNFGHIAFVQEKLIFGLLGEEMSIPKDYEQLFGPGTKPAKWEGTPPSLAEIAAVLAEQKTRIKDFIQGRLHEKLPTPFTNRGGITLYTAGEALLFSFYHEALHIETIKRLYRSMK
jgi:DinB superfamily